MTKKYNFNNFPKEKSVNINCKRQVFNSGIANTWKIMYICIEKTLLSIYESKIVINFLEQDKARHKRHLGL